jgi:hypothetical protein
MVAGMPSADRAGRRGATCLPVWALIEVIVRHGFRLGGIELGRLVEVVGEGSLGGLFCFCTGAPHGELGLGWPPGGMDQWGRSGLTDVGQDLCDGLRVVG